MAEKPRDEFLPTLGRCLLGMVIAILLGCFVGYGLLIMIGHSTELTSSQDYLDRVAASREGFTAQSMEYQQAADILHRYPGLKVLRTASGEPLYWQDGQAVDPASLMDETFEAAIERLFADSEAALSIESPTTEEVIEDMRLYNIAIDDQGHVCFYLYYNPNGFICIVYDEDDSCAEDPTAVAIMTQWYILMDTGDLEL